MRSQVICSTSIRAHSWQFAFDAGSLKVTGEPSTVAERIAEVGENHEFDFSVSDDGTLAYQSGQLTHSSHGLIERERDWIRWRTNWF